MNILKTLRGAAFALLATLSAVSVSQPAHAQTAEAPPVIVPEADYVSTAYTADMRQRLVNGEEVRIESRNRRNGMIYRWDGMTNTLVRWTYIRPHGHAENIWTSFYYCTDGNGRVVGGNRCQPIIADTSRTLNGNASLGRAAASGVFGMLPAIAGPVAGNLTSPCRNGGCSQGPGVINIVEGATAIAGAEAISANTNSTRVDINAGAMCASSGACGSPDPHRQ